METIKEVLMSRDGLTEKQANESIKQARERFDDHIESGDIESSENICAECFGLEPDFLMEFL